MNDPQSDSQHLHTRFPKIAVSHLHDQMEKLLDSGFIIPPPSEIYYRCPICHKSDTIADTSTTANAIICIYCRVPMISIHRYGKKE